MATNAQSTPMQGPFKPASAHRTAQALTAARASHEATRPQQKPVPLALDLVELELALDLSDISDRGFCDAVRDAAVKINGEFLFDLPASGLVEDAQRIAVVCLSRDNGGRLGQLISGDTVPEFEAVLDALAEGSLAPEPVASRYGLHIIRLDARAQGAVLPFEAVAPRIRETLEKVAWAKAGQDFFAKLAREAEVTGINLIAA